MINQLTKLANHLDSIGLRKEADYLDALVSHYSEPGVGQKVENVNPGCKHFGSTGVVQGTKNLPDEQGTVVVYLVNNNGETYSEGDTLEKTVDQLKVIG